MKAVRYSRKSMLLSLLALAATTVLVSTTSPVSNILVGLAFFVLVLFLLINLGYFLLSLGGRSISRAAKIKIIITSTFIVLGAMFLSVQSLNWGSGLTLMLLAAGMLFYTSRRT